MRDILPAASGSPSMPVCTGPDDTQGMPRSGLAPFSYQFLTVEKMAERAARISTAWRWS